MIDLDEAMNVCKSFSDILCEKPLCYGETPFVIFKTCEMLKAFGWEWGHDVYYKDFRFVKGYLLDEPGTDHKSNPQEWYVEWNNGNVGAYQFVCRSGEYNSVQNEYQEFVSELMKYNPLNYDKNGGKIIYDVENGKKLLDNYESIVEKTQKKIDMKIISLDVEKAKERYEELLKKQEQMKKEIDI